MSCENNAWSKNVTGCVVQVTVTFRAQTEVTVACWNLHHASKDVPPLTCCSFEIHNPINFWQQCY